MSTLLLALLACSEGSVVRRFHVTATYGAYELVGMDGNVAGTVHGYHVDGQFGLPTLVVNRGDTIVITLQNDTFEAMGLHPHGVRYDKDNDGVERVAAPGESVTYTWEATEGAGNFLYHSHQMDASGYEYQAEAGVLGALVVLDPAEPPPDRMLTYLLMSAYEPWTEAASGTSTPAEEREPGGIPTRTALPPPPAGTHDTGGGDTSHAHGSGGGTLGTHNHTLVTQVVSGEGWLRTDTRESGVAEVAMGETLRVNLVSFGSEFHTFHLHGHTWTDPGTGLTLDTVAVGPGEGYGFTLPALDNPGRWNVHCHVESHNHSMWAWLDVN